jgi:hypothetical protein
MTKKEFLSLYIFHRLSFSVARPLRSCDSPGSDKHGKKNQIVYQFKITLYEIGPCIWRRIQGPAKYNFWDFYVAIQDAMGWLDYHLNVFRFHMIRPRFKK